MARLLRFTVILGLAALGTALAAIGGWQYARASAPVNGPVILISIATLRTDHLPLYGYDRVKTPAIDALAADGTVFDRAYSHSPQTLPAHVSLLSGRLPFETGVRDEVGFTLKSSERLLPQMLRERGFTTAGIVSTNRLGRETGISRGFDFFDDEMPAGLATSLEGTARRDGVESEAIAERWLDQQRSSRVFLFLQLNDLHGPYAAPSEDAPDSSYDAAVERSDKVVGRLIRFLKSHQLYDQSTIVLLSDHGEGLGDHGETEHGLFVYNEVIHVPLVVKQSAGLGGGRRIGTIVQHVDLVPTLLDLAKAPLPNALRGRSLKPLLENGQLLENRLVYSEAGYGRHRFGWSGLASLTDGRFQYISAPRVELYDLSRDPGQQENRALEEAKVRTAMERALGALRADSHLDEDRPDPKDKLDVVEKYRKAVALADNRQWPAALALLRQIVHTEPDLAEVWNQLAVLASRMDRFDVATDAYRHVAELKPTDASSRLGAAEGLLKQRKFEAARDQVKEAAELAGDAPSTGVRTSLASHELLARIALAQHDEEAAREEAEGARHIRANSPLPDYIEARLLYDEGRYDEALPLLEKAAAAPVDGDRPLAELHFLKADVLVKLDRATEAEEEFLEELKYYPQNTRARAALAVLYRKTGQSSEAEQALADLVAVTPTPESYALAANVWTTFGDRQRANAVRAEARTAFRHLP